MLPDARTPSAQPNTPGPRTVYLMMQRKPMWLVEVSIAPG
jgi:hypothetical protein